MNVTGYGVYLPYWRLDRATIGEALGAPAGAGSRAVASFDEDSTSMGVEAGRVALGTAAERPRELWFATTSPAYADKTNATAIHAALGLTAEAPAYDVVGSVRSGLAALRAASDAAAAGRSAMAVLSDVRTGLSGSGDERGGGDAAAAFLFSPDAPALATELAWTTVTREFTDRWRIPGEPGSKVWEERFGETAYLPLAQQAVSDALARAGLLASDITHLVVAGLHERACSRVANLVKVDRSAVRDDLRLRIGAPGAAQPGVLLASVLDVAQPGEVICLVTLADGADCLLMRATEALSAARPHVPVAARVHAGRSGLSYQRFLSWRGLLRTEPPRRPDPDRPAAPPALRNVGWKFGFEASRCTECGTRHLPPERVCMSCRTIDKMQPERLADVQGRITTYTVDRLAFSAAPPVIAAIVDFDGGGRYACELTDVDPDEVAIGQRVEMSFRRLYSIDGVHDYFWKARPVREFHQPKEA
ncbi:MAG TPA: OB-fold domain-containing protein [Pseudonocardia sp.]|jgi:3-hydroxy-3-methylglutaryl CoA synthase/uncharacterized OB-fold protein